MFDAAARYVVLAGNEHTPLSEVALSVEAGTWIVCEVSSFALEDVHEFRCDVAVLLNVEPDHLDRHADFEAYRAAKLRIFERAARRSCPPGRGWKGWSSAPATRFRPSRFFPAGTTARTRRRRWRRRARRASSDGAIARGARDVRRRAAPARDGAGAAWRPLRQRLQGDERRRRRARARDIRGRAGARHPRRIVQGRGLRPARGRGRAERPLRPFDRRRGGAARRADRR